MNHQITASLLKRAQHLWRRLVEPTAIKDAEQSHLVRLLNGTLLVMVILGLIAEAGYIVNQKTIGPEDLPALVTLAFLGLAYALSRRGQYRLAIVLTLGLTSLAIFTVYAIVYPDAVAFGILFYLVLPLLVAEFFLDRRGYGATATLILLGILGLVQMERVPVDVFFFFLILSVVIGLAGLSRRRLERDRQAVLRVSEDRYRDLVENSQDLICTHDLEGRLLSANPAAARMLGYDLNELIGQNLRDYLAPEVRSHFRYYLGRLKRHGSASGRMVVRTRSGERRIWEYQNTVRTEDVAEPMVRGMARDVTERKQAETALRESEMRFRALIENNADAIALINAEGRIMFASPAYSLILGYANDELVGRNALELVHPDDAASATATLGQIVQTPGASFSTQLRQRHRDGAWHWLEGTVKNLLADPSVQALVVNFRDITTRKQAEAALLQSNRELGALNRIGQALSRVAPPAELIELIYQTVGEVVDNRNFYLALYDEATQSLSFALYTIDGERHAIVTRPLGQGLTEYILRTRAPLLITHDMDTALRERGITGLGRGSACYLGVPLLAGDKALGVIALQDYERERIYTIHDGELLTTIAAQAAIALENARLFAETRQRLEQLQALRTIDIAISASLDLRLTLNVVLRQVTSQLGVHAAAVLLVERTSQTLTHMVGHGFRSRNIEHSRVGLGHGLAGRAALEHHTVYVPDLSANDSNFTRAHLIKEEGFVAYYATPLSAKGQVVGVLEVFHRAPLSHSPDWVSFLEILAGQAAIAIDNAQLFESLQRSNLDLMAAYDTTLEGWSRALDLRDEETEGHSQRVTDLTLRLAQAMGMTDDELMHVRRGALLHDIGKMGVPDAILLKPGKLTDDEWVVMKKHPQHAYDMLLPIAYLRPALDIPYCHHEKWDGTGYPRQLKGEAIPLSARIFAVVDVWDALRSDRPYRPAWPPEKVLEHIRAGSGAHFDPAVVQAFLRVMEQN